MSAPKRSGTRLIHSVAQSPGVVNQLSLPSPAEPRHAPLAAANLRSREDAQSVLERSFPSLGIRRSCQATDATTLAVGAAAAPLIEALGPDRLLDDAFRSLSFRGKQIRLVRDKVTRDLGDIVETRIGGYAGGHTRVRAGALAAALDDGFTASLDGFDLRSPATVILAGLFERAFGCQVNINGYLSCREYTSFGTHWDDQEVVILQLVGSKDWTVEEPAHLSMNKLAHRDGVSGRVAWQGRLAPGGTLYVPRGWGHTVNGIDELSFHYTITIPRLHGLHVLETLLERLPGQNPGPHPSLPMTAGAIPTLEWPIDPAATDSLVLHAQARSRFSIPRRSAGSLRVSALALVADQLNDVFVRCPCPGGWVVRIETCDVDDDHLPWTEPGQLIGGMAGQLVQVPAAAIEAVGSLTDGRVHNARDFDRATVRDLITLGLLDVVSDPESWGLDC